MLKLPLEERKVKNNSYLCKIVSSIVFIWFVFHHKKKNFGAYTQILNTNKYKE